RPDHAGKGEHTAEVALVLAAVAGRHDVADDGLGGGYQAAGAHALDGPEADQLAHVVGQTGQHRSDEEDEDGGLEDPAPAAEGGGSGASMLMAGARRWRAAGGR